MTDVAATLGPVRLREVADGLKREALWLSSEWGGPLAQPHSRVLKAIQGPLGDGTGFVLGTWERELADLGNELHRFSSRVETVLEELAYIAQIESNGFAPPARQEDLAPTISAWATRSSPHMAFTPGGLTAHGPQGSLRQIDTSLIRQVIGQVENVAGELDGCRRRLAEALRPLGLEAPAELHRMPEDLRALARELRQRVEILETADAVTQSAATSVVAAFGGLFTRKTVMATVAPPAGTKGAKVPAASRAAGDAKRLMKELNPKGFFDVADFDRGRNILNKADRASRRDTDYAAAFLRALGPENLRWLIENGQLDPCKLGAVAARASQNGVGVSFLKKTLGTDRFDAPRRAALLSACDCPDAQFDPAWVEAMSTSLLTGRDPSGPGDPRKWYRQAAANMLHTHPAGAIQFINKNEKLFCENLFRHQDQGGKAAQGALDEMLGHPPAGLERQADNALERVLACAVNHEPAPQGKHALAKLLTESNRLHEVAMQLAQRGAPADAPGFRPGRTTLVDVIPDLMTDSHARQMMLEAAHGYARVQLAVFLAQGDENRTGALKQVGALFGLLAGRSYSVAAALDVRAAAQKSARDLLAAVGGTAIEAAKAHPVISLAVQGGSAILFDLGEAAQERQQLERDLKNEETEAMGLDELRSDLLRDLEHLTYVSLLSDEQSRVALVSRLSPADLPALDEKWNLPVETREEWRTALFDRQGRLLVPSPSDPIKWPLFVTWADIVNPGLYDRVTALTNEMFPAFESVRVP